MPRLMDLIDDRKCRSSRMVALGFALARPTGHADGEMTRCLEEAMQRVAFGREPSASAKTIRQYCFNFIVIAKSSRVIAHTFAQ